MINRKNSTTHKPLEKAFFLDCGRKYFSPSFFERLFPIMRQAGLNAIYLHFSEDMGLRLESKQFPFLAGGDHTLCVYGSANGMAEDDKKFLTQNELRYIVSVARDYGISVIPSLDSPGHMNYAVKKYNEHYKTDIGNYFLKDGRRSVVQGSSLTGEDAQRRHSRGIDISNGEAVNFVRALLTEYGELFRELGAVSFDVGGDELLGFGESIDDSYSKWQSLEHWQALAREKTNRADAVAYDAFLLYMNETADYMRSMGYTSIRMWNDDVLRDFDTDWRGAVSLDENIEIEFWSPYANGGKNDVFSYINAGHKIYNLLNHYTYYVLGIGAKNGVTPERLLEEWSAYEFDEASAQKRVSQNGESVLGGAYCLWCDSPSYKTEGELIKTLSPYLIATGKALSKTNP